MGNKERGIQAEGCNVAVWLYLSAQPKALQRKTTHQILKTILNLKMPFIV